MPVYCSKSFLRVSPCRFQVLVNPPSRHWSNNAKHQTPHDRPPVLWAVEGTGAKFSHLWAKQLAYQLLCGQSPNKTTEITNLSLRFLNAGVGDDFFRNRDGKKNLAMVINRQRIISLISGISTSHHHTAELVSPKLFWDTSLTIRGTSICCTCSSTPTLSLGFHSANPPFCVFDVGIAVLQTFLFGIDEIM